mgnify:CR=1 FL=1
MMAFQSAGQTTFISLGMGKYATIFSLFRKVILVIPLTTFFTKFMGFRCIWSFLC